MIHSIEEADLSYVEQDPVYPVREDSLVLLRAAMDELDEGWGNFMEMGCGTGITSLAAAKKGWRVLSADREPRALGNLRSSLRINGLRARTLISDLFEGIPRAYEGEFSLIVFNPPYLPSEGNTIDRRMDLPLMGGKSGMEVSFRFLEEVPGFLKSDGNVLLLSDGRWTGRIIEHSLDGLKFLSVKDSVDLGDHNVEVLKFHRVM